MAYTIFDAGFLDWFENRHLTATFSDLLGTFNHTASQVWEVTKSDVAPGLAAFLPECHHHAIVGSPIISESTKAMWLKKTLPELTTDGWYSQKIHYRHEFTVDVSGNPLSFTDYLTLMALESDTAEIASLRTIGIGQINTGLAYLYIGETSVGSFALPQGTPNQIELRYKVSATEGLAQIWLNGTSVLTYIGDTGTTPVQQVAYYSGKNCPIYVSSFVYSNVKRIRNKIPVLAWLAGPGSVSDGDVQDYLGNWSGSGSASTYSTTTLSTQARFADPGTVTGFMVNLNAPGTYKVGIVTVNANDASKRTVKYMSDLLSSASAGIINLTAGVDFPGNWSITRDDAAAMYVSTAIVGAEYKTEVDWTADGYQTMTYRLQNADGINTSDVTEKTYTLCAETSVYSFGATYAVTDSTKAYKVSHTQSSTIYAPKNNNNHHFSLGAAGETNKFEITNLPIPCVDIKTIKIRTSAMGSEELSKAEFIIDVGGTETTVINDLPTSFAPVDTYITGTWSQAQFNSAQIGIRAKPSV